MDVLETGGWFKKKNHQTELEKKIAVLERTVIAQQEAIAALQSAVLQSDGARYGLMPSQENGEQSVVTNIN